MNKYELAWTAGYIDGEGTFAPRGISSFQLTVTSCDRENLERFIKAVNNIGAIYGPIYKEGNRRIQWRYETTSFEKTQAVLAMVWPYLGRIKRNQAIIALIEIDYRREKNKIRPMQVRGNAAHGTRTRYGSKYGCRCSLCKKAESDYYYSRKNNGTN